MMRTRGMYIALFNKYVAGFASASALSAWANGNVEMAIFQASLASLMFYMSWWSVRMFIDENNEEKGDR